jgi:methylmalonyl-CoA mutase cobalamin-binding domain/chain
MSIGDDREPTALERRIADLDEEGSLDEVRESLAKGDNPLTIIEECQIGMRHVGESYQSGKYFISGLIMAGEIFREAMEILAPLMPEARPETGAGSIVLCTVQGDIHDLGKNILDMLLRSYGFTVHDLGVDVSPAEVVERVRALKPDIVGLSALLTSAEGSMKETVTELRSAAEEMGRPIPIIVGGGLVSEQIRDWTGADMWANDAVQGVRLIRQAVAAARR